MALFVNGQNSSKNNFIPWVKGKDYDDLFSFYETQVRAYNHTEPNTHIKNLPPNLPWGTNDGAAGHAIYLMTGEYKVGSMFWISPDGQIFMSMCQGGPWMEWKKLF